MYSTIICLRGNPQRIDTPSSNKQVIFTYEQVLGNKITRKEVGLGVSSSVCFIYFGDIYFLYHLWNFSLHFIGIQCLMYMYHYPDVWYDYATWHAKGGLIDAAVKVFQRSLKALPG